MSENNDIVGTVFGWVGSSISLVFFIMPVIPFSKLIRGRLTYKEVPGILLICSFLNCILWTNYGLNNDNFIVYFANSIGGTITLIFITTFLIHFAERKILRSLLLNLALIGVVVGLSFLTYFVVSADVTVKIAMIFNILMYAAPGEKIYTVYKTGNYNLIPIFSTVAGLFCSACWLIFGIYQGDENIIIPNALGVVFAILQLVVYVIFKKKNKIIDDKKEEKNEDEE